MQILPGASLLPSLASFPAPCSTPPLSCLNSLPPLASVPAPPSNLPPVFPRPCRFVKFGGGISAHQLTWLRGELAAAAAARQRVIVACHLVFYPGTAPNTCLLWNYEEVLQARCGGAVSAGLLLRLLLDLYATELFLLHTCHFSCLCTHTPLPASADPAATRGHSGGHAVGPLPL